MYFIEVKSAVKLFKLLCRVFTAAVGKSLTTFVSSYTELLSATQGRCHSLRYTVRGRPIFRPLSRTCQLWLPPLPWLVSVSKHLCLSVYINHLYGFYRTAWNADVF